MGSKQNINRRFIHRKYFGPFSSIIIRCLIPHLGDYILYVAFWEKIQKAVQTFTKSIAPDLYQRTNEELVVCKCKETENYQKCGKLMKAEKFYSRSFLTNNCMQVQKFFDQRHNFVYCSTPYN